MNGNSDLPPTCEDDEGGGSFGLGNAPELSDGAYAGVVGEMINLIAPYTEAHPAGIYVAALTGLSAIIGEKPHLVVGRFKFPAKLFSILVGENAEGRKLAAWTEAKRNILLPADPDFCGPQVFDGRILSGFPSGESIVTHCANQEIKTEEDVRLLIFWDELGGLFRIAAREGNTLSPVIRSAWDTTALENRAKTNPKGKPQVSEHHHIAVHGHITPVELRQTLKSVDAANGFGSRFLWVYVERTHRYPYGGTFPPEVREQLTTLGQQLRRNVEAAKEVYEVKFDDGGLWADLYDELIDDKPLLEPLRSIISRRDTHVPRLALVLALSDGSEVITADYLKAAYWIWLYCRASAELMWPADLRTLMSRGRSIGPTPKSDEDKLDYAKDKVRQYVDARSPFGAQRSEIYRAKFSGQTKIGKEAIEILLKDDNEPYEERQTELGARIVNTNNLLGPDDDDSEP